MTGSAARSRDVSLLVLPRTTPEDMTKNVIEIFNIPCALLLKKIVNDCMGAVFH